MPRWSGKAREFCVEMFLKKNSIIAAIRAYRREFKIARHDSVPDRKIILKKWRWTQKKQWWSTTLYTNECEYREGKANDGSESYFSVWKRTKITGIPRILLRWILREDLHLHPFKIQITQQLQPGDPMKHKMFCERMLNLLELNSNFTENVMFTDEVHFDLFGNVLYFVKLCCELYEAILRLSRPS